MDHQTVQGGLDPLWVSTALLVVTYAAIVSEKLNRAAHPAGTAVSVSA